MTTPHAELLPCPFCGGKAVHSEGRKGGNQPWHYVECLSCAAMAEPDVWNRRAAPTVEGWKLVPVEPTGEMILAGLRMVDVVGQYKAMLAAAPKDKP